MPRERDEIGRQHPARQPVFRIGNQSPIIFLTVCTHDRRELLDNPEIHQLLLESWAQADHWLVGYYLIMPDHIHLFCAPAYHDSLSLERWVAYWKSTVTRSLRLRNHKPAVWQQDKWDRQLRSHENYAAQWEYVKNNPVRAGLVESADDWPYQGEISVFHWHDT